MAYFTSAEFGPLAQRAYVFGLAPVTMYRRYCSLAIVQGVYNRLVSRRPNADTARAEAWLDLGDEPLVISIPALGDRYYAFQLTDVYGYNFHNIGNCLAYGSKPEYRRAYTFAIVGPSWVGEVPGGLDTVLSPGRFAHVIYRIGMRDERDDAARVRELQDCTTVVPLSAWRRGARNSFRIRWTAAMSSGIGFFEMLGTVLREDPPHTQWDRAFVESVLTPLSITERSTFHPDALTPLARRELLEAAQSAHAAVLEFGRQVGERKGTWVYTDRRAGAYAGDFLLRAAMVVPDTTCPTLQVSRSATASTDATGAPLRGDHNYILRFEPSRRPPVPFWSLTVYAADAGQLVGPPLHNSGLTAGRDGSLTIRLSAEPPAKRAAAANWMRTPEMGGDFYVVARLYAPSAPVQSLDYTLPPLERAPSK